MSLLSGNNYKSDIQMGHRYRDEQTGVEGIATMVTFFQYACERVNLEVMHEGKILDYGFDAPRLVHVESGVRATTERTGGPGDTVTGRDTARRPTPGR